MGSKESGRPKYTKAVHETIIKALQAGAFRKHAAAAAGIHVDTMEVWLKQGAEGKAPYAKFYQDVEAAVALDAIRNQAAISKAAVGSFAGDWKAAAWNLTKKHPRLYGGVEASPEAPARVEPPVHSPWKDGPH